MLTRETIAVLRECSERSVAGEITSLKLLENWLT
jgi:hypothetical protein